MNRAIRNIGRRPLLLNFANKHERVLPMTISDYHSEAEWEKGFAFKQASKYVSDREAVWVEQKQDDNPSQDNNEQHYDNY